MLNLIKERKSKEERFEILSKIAKYQLDILNNSEKIKLLGIKNNEEKSFPKVRLNWEVGI